MKYAGGCHCKAVQYALDWPAGSAALPARRCTCGYCTRFDGTWTSHPDACLEIRFEGDPPERYRFGTQTADFLFCSTCGTVVAALCELDGEPRAVVNVNTLDGVGGLELDHSDSDFGNESVSGRLDRRRENWIGRVAWRNP